MADRRVLPDPRSARPELATPVVAPTSPIEDALARSCAQVLGLAAVGVDDDFFELGGDSLLATHFVSRIRERFDVEIPLRTVFESPTVGALALAVADGQRVGQRPPPPIAAADGAAAMELSFAQQRLWFMDQLVPGNPMDNLPCAWRCTGHLDPAALEAALHEVVARHDSLRTTFPTSQRRPSRRVEQASALPIDRVDLAGLAPPDAESEALRIAATEAGRSFDLERGPLARAVLISISADDHVLLLTVHHIISDWWSTGVLAGELAATYAAFTRAEPSPLPPLPVRYGDFAAWQRGWLQGDVLDTRLAYWRAHLAGAPPALELPSDHPRPPLPSYRGATVDFELPAGVAAALKAVGRGCGATLFMTMLAGFKVLLGRYVAADDIVVGTATAGRTRYELEELVGVFVNTLALRTDLSGDPSFTELVSRVRETALGAYSYQDVPFEQVVDDLTTVRDLSRHPLVQVGFQLVPRPGAVPLGDAVLEDLGGLSGGQYGELGGGTNTARLDLAVFVAEDAGGGVRGTVLYAAELFERDTVVRLADHYCRLLDALAARPGAPISEPPLLGEAESRRLLVDWNDTATQYPAGAGIHHLVADQARRTPDAVAVAFKGDEHTYRDLDVASNRLARHLRSLGVGPECIVGLCVARGPRMLVGLLGVLKAGGAYLPLDPDFPADRLAYMLENSAASVVVTEAALVASLPDGYGGHLVRLDTDAPAIDAETPTEPEVAFDAGQLAYVLYTSGSTGRPKGVAVSHRAVVNFLCTMADRPGLDAGDVVLAVTTLSFDIAVLEIFLPLIRGAAVVVATREAAADPGQLTATIAAGGVTVMQATPTTWRMLLDAGWKVPDGLKVLCGGEALPAELADRLLDQSREVWNLYGPTETTVWSTVAKLAAGDPVTIGRPIANTTVYVLDARLRPVPVGVPGELHIGGAGVAREYLHRPELTAERFIAHPFDRTPGARVYKTGDLARWRADGALEHLGRLDHQVKVRGFRIELAEVEAALLAHPAVTAAVVVVREDTPGDARLVGYIVADPAPPAGDLRDFLRSRLPAYMIPSIMVLDQLPLTPNGKIDRKGLPAPDGRAVGASYVPPRPGTEETLAGIWAEVLGVPTVGLHDDFFELGGHSLRAAHVAALVRDRMGVDIAVRAVFDSSSLCDLAAAVDLAGETRSAGPALVALDRSAFLA
ncbi:MAG TPA: amino acid adenylation domain-containing protein [Acidimicrobiales bacterium]|nr:amino acid adenylation domain-containing protein [Acidimicrobiales bacterium]